MVRTDCRHFPGDRPCDYHKAAKTTCLECNHYAPRGTTILVIKMDALGDVLRTTSILPSLHRKYNPCHITWITSPAAADLFVGNTLVDHVLSCSSEYLPQLLNREFDTVINPDAAWQACELAALARSDRKLGFISDQRGEVVALSQAARRWLEMGACDQTKRTNRKTYQQILHEICNLDPRDQHIVLALTDEEEVQREELAVNLGVNLDRPVIGMNTGAGSRWKLKKWRVDGFTELIRLVLDITDAEILLIGGEQEQERNARIRAHFSRRVHWRLDTNLRGLMRQIALCDVVVTGDTLALHAALGLRKRVVAIFGPTSAPEIDIYGLGTKIVPELDCICCYRMDCDRSPTCVDLVSPQWVLDAVLEQLEAGRHMDSREHIAVGEPGR
jgi:ADP-heptose:LPS heptosyltransferase